MNSFITALTSGDNGITATNLWSSLSGIAPFIGGMVLFGFAVYALRKAVKKAQKGKGGF